MEQGRSMDTRHGIADTLISGASLLVGYLPYGISLTSPTVLATLAEDGPTRLTALAAGTGVSQPAMTQCAGRMERDDLAVRLIDPEGARDTGRCHRRRAGTVQGVARVDTRSAGRTAGHSFSPGRGHAGHGHAGCVTARRAADPRGRPAATFAAALRTLSV